MKYTLFDDEVYGTDNTWLDTAADLFTVVAIGGMVALVVIQILRVWF